MRALQCNLDVATLHGQVEACALILDEVQCHLWEALLLQIAACANRISQKSESYMTWVKREALLLQVAAGAQRAQAY